MSAILGIVISVLVVWLGVMGHATRPTLFLDTHALLLVFGGTLGAALVAYPLKNFREILSFLFMAVLYPKKKAYGKLIEQLLELSAFPDPQQLTAENRKAHHPFLAEGYRLIQRQQLSLPEFKSVLQQRSMRFRERYVADARMLAALGKFPPAFGLLGATTGMIAMMTDLAGTNQDSIGPSMAIALVATFWGIALANFIILPLADHASKLADDDTNMRLLIMTGLVLIYQRARPYVILDHLIGFLPVEERENPQFRSLAERAEIDFNAYMQREQKAIERQLRSAG